jgi:hypothetical protein
MALNMGIKCKNTPDRFAPIMDIPFIHSINEARPGSKTTYDKIKINGVSILILKPI